MQQMLLKHDYGAISTERNCNALFLHVKWNEDIKFTKSIYKECLNIFGDVIAVLKQHDIDEVFSCIPKTDKKALKWQTLFGMEPLIETAEHIIFRGIF